jgi:cell division protein FtsQ
MERPVMIDRRIAQRRQTVREARARRRLRWLLVILGLAGGAAFVAWSLYQSAFLSVSQITISGATRSPAAEIVESLGVVPGVPTVSVPDEEIEAGLIADPWIAAADVVVRWPGTVDVTVVEHVPAAWVGDGEGWALTAAGGAVVELAERIPEDAPRITVGRVFAEPGSTIDRVDVVAAVEFLGRLPAALVAGATVSGDADALRAQVQGFEVELGYPSDMTAKATALTALLRGGQMPPGSVISVVSPARPAVLTPPPLAPRPNEVRADADASGEGASDDGTGDDGTAGDAGADATDEEPSTSG